MNIATKVIILDTILSIGFTVMGGGNFYSFLFFFILLLLPSIFSFMTYDTIKNSFSKKKGSGPNL